MGIKVMVRGANINFGELFGYFWKRALIIYQGYISKKKNCCKFRNIYVLYIPYTVFSIILFFFIKKITFVNKKR